MPDHVLEIITSFFAMSVMTPHYRKGSILYCKQYNISRAEITRVGDIWCSLMIAWTFLALFVCYYPKDVQTDSYPE